MQRTGNWGEKIECEREDEGATEQIFGRAAKEAGQATGQKTTASKGAASGARGKARHLKEKATDKFKP